MLAPWCANEKWSFFAINGRRYARVEGRERCPLRYRLNPLWWGRNDYEQSVDEAPWFYPDWPHAVRAIAWALRNPFENGNLFVWGIADRNYTVEVLEGNPDPLVIQRDDVGETGYQRARLTLDDGTIHYWTSYSDAKVVRNYGYQPSGLFEVKINLKG